MKLGAGLGPPSWTGCTASSPTCYPRSPSTPLDPRPAVPRTRRRYPQVIPIARIGARARGLLSSGGPRLGEDTPAAQGKQASYVTEADKEISRQTATKSPLEGPQTGDIRKADERRAKTNAKTRNTEDKKPERRTGRQERQDQSEDKKPEERRTRLNRKTRNRTTEAGGEAGPPDVEVSTSLLAKLGSRKSRER